VSAIQYQDETNVEYEYRFAEYEYGETMAIHDHCSR